MNEDNIDKLYNNLLPKYGEEGLGSKEQFTELLSNEDTRNKFYNNIAESEGTEAIGTLDQFNSLVGDTNEFADALEGGAKQGAAGLLGVPDFLFNDIPKSVISSVGNFIFDTLESSNFDITENRADFNKIVEDSDKTLIGSNRTAKALAESDIRKELLTEGEQAAQRSRSEFDGKNTVELLGDLEFGKAAKSLAVDITGSLPQLGAIATTGGAGIAAVGLSQAANATDKLIEEGVDQGISTLAGGLIGASEAFFEKIGTGVLVKQFKDTLRDSGKDAAEKLVKDRILSTIGGAGLEGTTELATEISQTLIEDIAKDDFPVTQEEGIRRYVTAPLSAFLAGAGVGGGLKGATEVVESFRKVPDPENQETPVNQNTGNNTVNETDTQTTQEAPQQTDRAENEVVETEESVEDFTPPPAADIPALQEEVARNQAIVDNQDSTDQQRAQAQNQIAALSVNIEEATANQQATEPVQQTSREFTDDRISERRAVIEDTSNPDNGTDAEIAALALKDGTKKQRDAFTTAQIDKKREAAGITPGNNRINVEPLLPDTDLDAVEGRVLAAKNGKAQRGLFTNIQQERARRAAQPTNPQEAANENTTPVTLTPETQLSDLVDQGSVTDNSETNIFTNEDGSKNIFFRGAGNAPSNPPSANKFGQGEYFTNDPQYASQFGDQIEQVTIEGTPVFHNDQLDFSRKTAEFNGTPDKLPTKAEQDAYVLDLHSKGQIPVIRFGGHLEVVTPSDRPGVTTINNTNTSQDQTQQETQPTQERTTDQESTQEEQVTNETNTNTSNNNQGTETQDTADATNTQSRAADTNVSSVQQTESRVQKQAVPESNPDLDQSVEDFFGKKRSEVQVSNYIAENIPAIEKYMKDIGLISKKCK